MSNYEITPTKKDGINFKTVTEIGEYSVKEHLNDEPFTSEKIRISQDMVNLFLKSTGDENIIHQTEEGAKKSVFAEKHPGKLIVPGFLTEAILANKNVLWKALAIDQPHESLNLSSSTRWTAPVPVGAEVFYTSRIKKVKNMPGKSDSDIKVDWSLVEFDTKAYYISENDEKIQCMETSYTVGYVPVKTE